jgi:hypothetical protein
MAAGASEEHAHYVADAITFAHKQGKLNQGLGVYEALDIALEMKLLDIKATPEVVGRSCYRKSTAIRYRHCVWW